MKIIKSVMAVFAILALLAMFGTRAEAQQYSVNTVRATNVAATTQVNVTNNIIATKGRFVGVGLIVTGGAGATNAVTATFQRGLSSSIWDTTTTHTLTVTGNASTQAGSLTNFDMGGFGYLRLVSITNGGASVATSTVYSVTKPVVLDQ